MLIQNATEEQWQQLYDNCCRTGDDLNHLNQYPYAGIRVPDGRTLIAALKSPSRNRRCWLIKTEGEDGRVIGFINYGSVIPTQRNAFGLAIGSRFIRQGHGARSMVEFLMRLGEFGIRELNGYCSKHNLPITKLMQRVMHGNMRFVQDIGFRDVCDPEAIHFRLII